jgi:hypothetical protein
MMVLRGLLVWLARLFTRRRTPHLHAIRARPGIDMDKVEHILATWQHGSSFTSGRGSSPSQWIRR